MTAKEDVKVEGKPVDSDDKKLDNSPAKDDSPELAAVKAEDRKQERINEESTDAGIAAAEKAADAAGDTPTVVVDGYGEGAAKPVPRKPKLAPKPAADAKKGVHVVEQGENLLDIATRFGVSVDSLKQLNNLHTGFSNPPVGTEIKLYPEHRDGTQG